VLESVKDELSHQFTYPPSVHIAIMLLVGSLNISIFSDQSIDFVWLAAKST
jgi:hypothetical protein